MEIFSALTQMLRPTSKFVGMISVRLADLPIYYTCVGNMVPAHLKVQKIFSQSGATFSKLCGNLKKISLRRCWNEEK